MGEIKMEQGQDYSVKDWEKIVDSERIFDGRVVRLRRDRVLLGNGSYTYREIIEHNGGVCVLPITDDDEIILVRQYRSPFNTVLTELPAGKLEKGEEPIECGIRELKEEVGATASEIKYLGRLYPTVAYDTEVIYMYMATGLSFESQHLDEDELVEIIKLPFDEAVEMVLNDELPDSKTQIAILKAAALRGWAESERELESI